MKKLSESIKALYIKTAKQLKGSARRQFMAAVVKELGVGGQSLAERELKWNRRTIRKGTKELTSGEEIKDGYERSGRKRVEEKLPQLLEDIKALVEPQTQTDPSFLSTRLYTRLSAAQVRRQLIKHKGYTEEELPSVETIRRRLNEMGYSLKRVQKAKPKKRIPETEEIFEHLEKVNQQADTDPKTLRISMDAKAVIKIGEFDRGGKTRVPTIALDHDFTPTTTITPYGIFLPQYQELYLFFVSSKLTADCIVDLLWLWWSMVKDRFRDIDKLVLNQDNGPENHSRRTQFLHRIVEFACHSQLQVSLAYYPPYHSKYNPVERAFGWLEQHWNGSLLDSVETVLRFAENLTFQGQQPVVRLVEKVYHTGVKLTQQAMSELEKQVQRFSSLPKWFVDIVGKPT